MRLFVVGINYANVGAFTPIKQVDLTDT